MTELSTKILLTIVFTLLTSTTSLGVDSEKSISDSFAVNSGYLKYYHTGINPKDGKNTSNVSLEWSHFYKKDLAPFVGYRLAYDSELGRSMYQTGYAGYRYYYAGLGVPISAIRSSSRIEYSFSMRPYVESEILSGRYLILTRGDFDESDISSDFYGFGFGTGLVYAFSERYAFDFKTSFEYLIGYGPVEFEAANLFVLLGMKYFI